MSDKDELAKKHNDIRVPDEDIKLEGGFKKELEKASFNNDSFLSELEEIRESLLNHRAGQNIIDQYNKFISLLNSIPGGKGSGRYYLLESKYNKYKQAKTGNAKNRTLDDLGKELQSEVYYQIEHARK